MKALTTRWLALAAAASTAVAFTGAAAGQVWEWEPYEGEWVIDQGDYEIDPYNGYEDVYDDYGYYDDYAYGDEYWYDDGGDWYEGDWYEYEYEGETWLEDGYGAYNGDYDWYTDDQEYDVWYGDADAGWDWF